MRPSRILYCAAQGEEAETKAARKLLWCVSLKWQGLNYAGKGSFDLCLSQNPREVKKELRDFPVFSSAFSDLSTGALWLP